MRGIDPVLDIGGNGRSLDCPETRVPSVPRIAKVPDLMRAMAIYRPQRHHAQGGLGEVLAARQEELGRLVALKRIRPERLHEAARKRFLREAEITAGLQHPGIVPIYGLGQDDDGPFYTMPLIEGQTLQEAIEEFHGDESLSRDSGQGSLRFRELLQKFMTVCDTVAYAHDQGVVHRDLKPSNIMLGRYGETLVMDWGLAKHFGTEDSDGEQEIEAPSPSPSPDALTATGAVLGTPQYMSPEQAKGLPTGPASDVFNLGLILYAILTGTPAFEEASLEGGDPLKAVRDAAVLPPRDRDPHLPRALDAICLKALAARPEDRYASARDLGRDLENWMADEPVTAYRRRWPRATGGLGPSSPRVGPGGDGRARPGDGCLDRRFAGHGLRAPEGDRIRPGRSRREEASGRVRRRGAQGPSSSQEIDSDADPGHRSPSLRAGQGFPRNPPPGAQPARASGRRNGSPARHPDEPGCLGPRDPSLEVLGATRRAWSTSNESLSAPTGEGS